jgi:hypothetical protein
MRDIALFLHFIGLAMGVGTSFAMMALGRAASKLEIEERIKFGLTISVLRRVGQIGLTLLILSGFYLMTPFWKTLSTMPFMITKLILVLILVILVSMIDINFARAKKGDPGIHLMKNGKIGPFALLTAILIIIMGVVSFH